MVDPTDIRHKQGFMGDQDGHDRGRVPNGHGGPVHADAHSQTGQAETTGDSNIIESVSDRDLRNP